MPVGRAILSGTPAIGAGQRDKHVLVEKTTPATSGFPVETWTPLTGTTSTSLIWMSRRDERADERFTAEQESAYKETVWQMPYRPDMDPDLVDVPALRRLSYLGRVYNIRSASMIGEKDGIEVVTLARVG